MVISPEIVKLMRERARAGIGPAQIIREIFDSFGVVSPFFLVDYFMEAYRVHHSEVMPHLNQWWYEPRPGNLTDEQLDERLEPVIRQAKDSWSAL